MFFYGLDPTYILVLIGILLCMAASGKVKRTFSKYSHVRNHSGMTGKEAAELVLQGAGLNEVRIEHIAGELTDNYDPRTKVLHLSDSTYNSPSVAAVGVAAHECGHAIQHARHYAPLTIRGALVPVANFGSTIAWPLIIIGLFLRSNTSMILIEIGIVAFSAAVVFQLVTLPVEFNASHRAIKILEERNILYPEEMDGTKKVLRVAALTYVASAASMILQLLRIILLTGGRRDD